MPGDVQEEARRRTASTWFFVLWVVFVIVQIIEIRLGWVLPNQPMGDVYNVYEPWSIAAMNGVVMGVTEEWVYPPVALLPMLAPHLLWGIEDYTLAWAVLVAILNAVGFGALLGRATSIGRRWAAMFWIAFLICFGPVTFFRIDGVTVPLAVIGVLYLARRPAVASALFAIGAWIKIWPGALLLAAFAVARRRWVLVWPALVVSALVVVRVVWGGGFTHLFGFLTLQNDRGMQAEALASTPWLWAGAMRVPGTGVVYNADIVTFQVSGAGTDVAAVLMTPLLVVVAFALAGYAWWLVRGGVPRTALLPPLALALVLSFIVFNKVGSPQFQVWLVAPVVLWLLWDRRTAWRYAVAVLLCATLTQFVYPIMYDRVVASSWDAVLVLTARNVVLVGLLVAVTRHIVRLRTRRVPEDRLTQDRSPA